MVWVISSVLRSWEIGGDGGGGGGRWLLWLLLW